MGGVDLRTVADILGHSNIGQTMKYTHMADDHKRKAVNLDMPWSSKRG
jgi:site-specific recombinase XerD